MYVMWGTMFGVSLVLITVALVATWIPAWQSSAVDPTVALRDQ
jgi:ABC-type lipoprotein release transport system permease subunit